MAIYVDKMAIYEDIYQSLAEHEQRIARLEKRVYDAEGEEDI